MDTEQENIGTEAPVEPQSEPVEAQPETEAVEPEVAETTEDVQPEVSAEGHTQTSEYHSQDGAVIKDEFMTQ
jgi:hypothetical protein